MSVIANLRVMLSGDDAKLKKSFKRTNAESKRWAKKVSARNKRVGKSFKRIGGAIGMVGGALVVATQKAITHADELAKSAKSIGISVESLQEYNFAAERSGVSSEEMTKGLQKFNKNMGEASRGIGTGKAALDELGISVRGTDGKLRSQGALLNEFTDKLSRIESPLLRASYANDAFGRSGIKMLPMLSDGTRGLEKMKTLAHTLGNVLSNETAAKAEILNDKIGALTTGLKTGFYTWLINTAESALPFVIRSMGVLEGVGYLVDAMFDGLSSSMSSMKVDMLNTGLGAVVLANAFGRIFTEHLPIAIREGMIILSEGVRDSIISVATSADKAIASTPKFIQMLFGYTKGGIGSGAAKYVDSVQSSIDKIQGQIEEIKSNSQQGPTVLEAWFLGNIEETEEKMMSAARSAANNLERASELFSGTGDKNLAGKVDEGIDSLAPVADDTEVNLDKMSSHWDVYTNNLKKKQTDITQNFGKSWKDIGASYAMNMASMGKVGKAFAIGEIIYSTSMAVMAAMTDKSVPSFYMRLANAGLATVMGVQALSSIKGQAHDGIDNVPSTGTYLLEKGERVVDSRLNGDLKAALSPGGGMGGSTGSQNITFAVTGVEDPDVINRVIQENRGDFESMLRQINADRAGGGLI